MRKFNLLVNGNPYEVKIKSINDEMASVECNGVDYEVKLIEMRKEQKTPKLVRKIANPHESVKIGNKTHKPDAKVGGAYIKAPIPGLIIDIMVKEGDSVTEGQVVVKMEAMKMENNITASSNGKIKSIDVKNGESILEGDVIMTLED